VLGLWLWPDFDHPGVLGGLAGLAQGFVIFGGLIVLLARGHTRPIQIRNLGTAIVDVHRGSVLVFEPATPPGMDAPALPPDAPRRIEVLPASKILYRFDEAVDPRLAVAPVVSVGRPATGPSPAEPVRDLSASEREELERARVRLRRLSIYRVLGASWFVAVILRAIENFLQHHLEPRLSGAGWLLTLAVAAYLTFRHVRWHRQLAADARGGHVERRNPPGSAVVERLPASDQVWAIEGLPAPWRLAIWD
jgi:hypothetical protein